jgi:hypothetical protein
MKRTFLRPSPALVVAVIALFVALGGTAGAVVAQTVPLAKRSLSADNAKKLGGKTLAQVVAQASASAVKAPGPASTAAGLVSVKTANNTIAANSATEFTIACDAGQKVLGGGFASDGDVLALDSHPANDSTWRVFLVNANETAAAQVALFATCLR